MIGKIFQEGTAVDWKVLMSTFLMIFLAELGDKTQLAIFSFSVKTKSALTVFIGAASALVVMTLIVVILGGVISKVISSSYIRYISGAIFIIFGVLVLIGK